MRPVLYFQSFCFPFNCVRRRANTGTNGLNCMRRAYNLFSSTKQLRAMAKIEELADRVERLLLRYGELVRTQQLVEAQLASVTQERDSLKSRLNTARSRIDALLDRLPTEAVACDDLNCDKASHEVINPGAQP